MGFCRSTRKGRYWSIYEVSDYLGCGSYGSRVVPAFGAARRAHAAVESAINNLECRGLNRVRAHGADGFKRMVGLSVLSTNFHRIGLILQHKERERLKLQCLRRAA